jgi:hypothetical protein
LPARSFAFKFLRQFTLQPLFFPGLQEKGMFLDFLDNTFLLDLPLETAQSALNGLSLKNADFRQVFLRADL